MSKASFDLPANLSESLSDLRKLAGLKQSEVAKTMGVDTSRVSRIETGEITPTDNEVISYCNAVGTSDANNYLGFLRQDWGILRRPLYNHPERDSLYLAEYSLQLLNLFREDKEHPQVLLSEAEMHEAAIRQAVEYLESTKHTVAYIGDIGVGKTSAICKQTELVLTKHSDKPSEPVFEVAGGGTTVCEVRILKGLEYAIHVEPLLDTEVYKLANDFCTGFKDAVNISEPRGVSKEIARALRNLSGLTGKKEKMSDGKIKKIDPVEELAKSCGSLEELCSEFNTYLSLSSRTCRKISYDISSGISALEWLQENFKKINNGRHPDFSIPRRIDVTIPYKPLKNIANYEVEVVDTKGIDGTSLRQDLTSFLGDGRTIALLCTPFNQAPNTSVQALIEYMLKTNQSKQVNEKLCLLVLPRPDEALAMKDDTGENAESDEDGYTMKREQVEKALQNIGVREEMPIYFFNSRSDDPNALSEYIGKQIKNLRSGKEEQIKNVKKAIDYLISNTKEVHFQNAKKEVSKRLKDFMSDNSNLLDYDEKIHRSFLSAIRHSHARTVWASMRRDGDWANLDIYLMLGIGSRESASKCAKRFNAEISPLFKDILEDNELEPAHQFVEQLRENIESDWLQKFVISSQQIGSQIFRPALENNSIWLKCSDLYGQGVSFREEVHDKFAGWFNDYNQHHLYDLLKTRIAESWQSEVLDQLNKLTE
ncbi:MAG: helix-turn-helix domain-containing protein [Pseudanabaena sp.]|jgi:transcriptional regulator with XRE-family HTH domain